jgi:hypothetical protein
MMARHQAGPPVAAVRLLEHCLPDDERDVIVGDLTQSFADRLERRRRWNRSWFWTQVVLFAATSLLPQPAVTPQNTRRLSMDAFMRSVRQAGRRLRHDWRFATGVVLILAAGLGPAAAMVSVVDTVPVRRILRIPYDLRISYRTIQ